jgi:hypothetical protein
MKHKLLFTVFFILLMQNCFSQTVALDPTFGTGGKVVNSSITDRQVIQLQSDGKIVSCYLSNFSSSGNIHLTRFNSDGSIDTSFGVNGFVNTILFTEGGGFNMMKIQSNDKIVIIYSSSISKSKYLLPAPYFKLTSGQLFTVELVVVVVKSTTSFAPGRSLIRL